MLLADCIACRYGDHEGHVEVVTAVPEGMLGGHRCPCMGNCVGRNRRAVICRACGSDECDGRGCAALDQERQR